jgi:hypothetical protein
MANPRYRAFAPNGHRITGTLERQDGECRLSFFEKHGEHYAQLSSDSTEWDDAKQVEENGQPMFLDDEGTAWPKSVLVFEPY